MFIMTHLDQLQKRFPLKMQAVTLPTQEPTTRGSATTRTCKDRSQTLQGLLALPTCFQPIGNCLCVSSLHKYGVVRAAYLTLHSKGGS